MKKKLSLIIAFVAAMALSAVMLAGCGGGGATAESEPQGAPAEGAEFIVGFDQSYPPYGFVGNDGNYTGFDLDLAAEVCERNGWSLEITRMFGSMPASFRACICSLRSIPNAADRPAAPAPTITASYISSTCFGLIATIFAQGVTSLRFAGWRVCRCMRGYACLMRMFSMDSVDLCRLGGGVVGRDVMWRLRR